MPIIRELVEITTMTINYMVRVNSNYSPSYLSNTGLQITTNYLLQTCDFHLPTHRHIIITEDVDHNYDLPPESSDPRDHQLTQLAIQRVCGN